MKLRWAGTLGWIGCTAVATVLSHGKANDGPGDSVPTAAIEKQALTRMRSLELASLLDRERKDWAAREAELLTRIDELTHEIESERKVRVQRETEWLEFTRALAVLPVPEAPGPPGFLQQMLDAAQEAPDPAAEAQAEASRRRSGQVLRDLRSLLAAEQVYGLDVLEVGHVGEDRTGPFVARLVDDYGRPVGSLAADSLRLEMSMAAHTVTLVLEGGYENRGGVRVPFAGEEASEVDANPTKSPNARRTGVRRIHLPQVDPGPWIEALPELFGDLQASVPLDDNLWNRAEVRARINDLMLRSSGGSPWRLRGLGGVWRGELRDVQFAEIGPTGRVERMVFADRVTLRKEGRGMRFDLIGGVQVRGDQRVPFLDGRFRIVLPRADSKAWVDSELPGLQAAEPVGQLDAQGANEVLDALEALVPLGGGEPGAPQGLPRESESEAFAGEAPDGG